MLLKKTPTYIQKVPTLRAFWDLGKTVLHEIHVSGTVHWSPTNANSPTYTYTSQTMVVETVLVIFVLVGDPLYLY